jgi:hypothetical protein
MTKLTASQAQAAQAKADRRAAAAERREGAVAADNARVTEMYAKVAPAKADTQEATIYLLDELDQIQDEVARDRAYQLAALWPIAVPGVAFPGVLFGQDNYQAARGGAGGNWYVNGFELPGDLPAMICSNGRLTQDRAKRGGPVGRLGYRYSTVTVRTALQRAMKGKPLFNYAD